MSGSRTWLAADVDDEVARSFRARAALDGKSGRVKLRELIAAYAERSLVMVEPESER